MHAQPAGLARAGFFYGPGRRVKDAVFKVFLKSDLLLMHSALNFDGYRIIFLMGPVECACLTM